MQLPAEFVNLFNNRLNLLHFPHFSSLAIRPSPVISEAPTEQISDLLHSIMNVENLPAALNAIKLVWASMWSGKACAFRQKNFIPHELMETAIIVQKMAKIDYSGEAYSRDFAHAGNVKIHAGWGIPDGIIERQVGFDTVSLKPGPLDGEQYSFTITEELVAPKEFALTYKGQEKAVTPVPRERIYVPILNSLEQQEIGHYARKLDEALGKPQIIVWGRERNIVILGAKPLETPASASTVWISPPFSDLQAEMPSNLSLSVSGDLAVAALQQFAKVCGEQKAQFGSPVHTLIGRLYINRQNYLNLLTKLKIPAAYSERIMRGVSLEPPNPDKTEKDLFNPGMMDPMMINHWIGKAEESLKKDLAESSSFLEKIRKTPYTAGDRKQAGENVTAIMSELARTSDAGTFFSLITLCLCILNKLEPGSGSGEIYRKIPVTGDTWIARYLLDTIELLIAAFQDNSIQDFFKKNAPVGEATLEDIKNSAFYRMFFNCIENHSSLAIFPLELSSPRFGENHLFYLRMIESLIIKGNAFRRIQSLKESLPVFGKKNDRNTIISGKHSMLGKWTKEGIIALLSKVMFMLGEFTGFSVELTALLRAAFLDISKSLYAAQVVEKLDDVFHLEIDELLRATLTKFSDFRAQIAERSFNSEVWQGYTAPDEFSGTRFNIESHLAPHYYNDRTVKGIPLGSGVSTGRIKKIKQPEDIFNLEVDEIALVRRLNFVHSPALLSGAGVIVEKYNPFLFDTIVCRILGIPGIAGLEGIFDRLRDGDFVKLNADEGSLTISGSRSDG
jgi:pyruvate,water dikinase